MSKILANLERFRDLLRTPNLESLNMSLNDVHHPGLFSLVIGGIEPGHTVCCKAGAMWVVEEQGFKTEESTVLGVPFTVDGLYNKPQQFQINDMCQMVLREMISPKKNAFLFMWVTNKYLLKSQEIIKAWGFEYVACIVWKKKRMGGGLGGVVRISSEYLLFCRRGNLKAIGHIPESVIEAKRPYTNGYPCNSKKPEIFIELIESISPDGNKLELSARNNRIGWDVFGNECKNSIALL